jgi:hypothetical protein
MRRRELIAVITSAIVTWPFSALAQQAGRTYRLGCLLPLPRDAPENIAFFDELRRRGFIDGQNLTVAYRAYSLHVDLISQYAVELVKARVDVRRRHSKRPARRAGRCYCWLCFRQRTLVAHFPVSLAVAHALLA